MILFAVLASNREEWDIASGSEGSGQSGESKSSEALAQTSPSQSQLPKFSPSEP